MRRSAFSARGAGAILLALVCACGRGGGEREAEPEEPPAQQAPADDDALVQVVPEGRIVAVEQPSFASVSEAEDFMRPDEPVVGVVVDGRARAYSLWHLDRHEIVNDRAGDTPLLVAWCPMAYTARAFRRESGGRSLTFGVSGQLWRNALVMRDRETGSLWSQVNGAAIEGPLQGAELTPIPAGIAPWSEWSRLHPSGLVLRKPPLDGTQYARYFANPEQVGFYGQKRRDPRLPPKVQVIGLEAAGRALAVPLEALRREKVWNDSLAGRPILLASMGKEGPEVAYARASSGRALTLDPGPGPGRARDRETGSMWDLGSGRGVAGPLAGSTLEPLPALLAYWFVWSAYHPGSDLRETPPQ